MPADAPLSLRDLGRAAGHDADPDPSEGVCGFDTPCPEWRPGEPTVWCPTCQTATASRYRAGLTLEDLPADHPIRQEVARLTVRVALLEGRIAGALERLTRSAEHTFRRTPTGELVESVGCHLTGRSGSWWPPSSPQPH